MYKSKPFVVREPTKSKSPMANHKPAKDNLSLEAHQMVGGPRVERKEARTTSDEAQENRKYEKYVGAQPCKVPKYVRDTKGNKIK